MTMTRLGGPMVQLLARPQGQELNPNKVEQQPCLPFTCSHSFCSRNNEGDDAISFHGNMNVTLMT